ncbi:MAG: hypothetical protein IJW59_00250 [Clostridia bacterium]|nr:hypothetical protein [Clostridia bacterium]
MKKETNLTFNIVRVCFCIIPLGLSLMFIYFAIKNPGIPSIKFYIFAGIFGLVGIFTLASYFFDIIQSKTEKKILECGVDRKGKIICAKFTLGHISYPNVSKKEEKYNYKPICENGQYIIKIAFESDDGKEIQKTAFPSPLLNKQQLSYLVEKGNLNIKVYKNKFALTQEMLDSELENMPQDQKIINLANNKIFINTGIYFKKSKKLKNALSSNTSEYDLYAKRKSSPNNVAQTGGGAYICKVKYYTNINGKNEFFINYLNIRDFSRIQANQNENLPLPLLIQDNKVYIDFNNLPII